MYCSMGELYGDPGTNDRGHDVWGGLYGGPGTNDRGHDVCYA